MNGIIERTLGRWGAGMLLATAIFYGLATTASAAAPANDNFTNAQVMTPYNEFNGVNYFMQGDSRGATHEPGETSHGTTGEAASVWGKWTAPASGEVRATTCFGATFFNTSLAVYTGSALGNLQLVGSNDDGTPYTSCAPQVLLPPTLSEVNFTATKGTTYFFAVDGKDGAADRYYLGLYVTRTARNLTTNVSGPGAGSVTSDPAGIDCGTPGLTNTCSTQIGDSRVITLTAHPAEHSTFSGWGGACAGTDACTLTMDDAKNVTASFANEHHDVTVSLAGTGKGSVSSDGQTPPACRGKTCVGTYDYGTTLTLHAVPAKGSKFSGWGGDCTGSGDCEVTLTKDMTVGANFSAPVTITLGRAVVNRKKGTARITARLDNAAKVKMTGKGVSSVFRSTRTAGKVTFPVAVKGKARRSLKKTGKVTVKVKVTATGSDGLVSRVSRTVKLRKG